MNYELLTFTRGFSNCTRGDFLAHHHEIGLTSGDLQSGFQHGLGEYWHARSRLIGILCLIY